jgi:hypothetical protein
MKQVMRAKYNALGNRMCSRLEYSGNRERRTWRGEKERMRLDPDESRNLGRRINIQHSVDVATRERFDANGRQLRRGQGILLDGAVDMRVDMRS